MTNRRLLVSIIVPTYNERENIPRLIESIHSVLSKVGVPYEVVVVDDNSPDGTADVVRKLSHIYEVKLLVRPKKMGLASAVLDGMKIAEGQYIAVMDADLQHPPEELPRMIEALGSGCDIVIGSRYVKGGSARGLSLMRRVVSRGADLLAKILLPETRGVRDTMSGYFAFKREVVRGAELNPRGFKILLEILVKGHYSKVCEHPIEFRERLWGRSKLGLGEILSYVLHALDLAHNAIRFVIVGGLGSLVNLMVVATLGYVLGVEHWVSVLAAFEVSTLFNFSLHELWTFKARFSRGAFKRLAEFHSAVLIHMVSQTALSNVLFYWYSIERVISQAIAIFVGFILNYLISRFFIWRRYVSN